MTRAEKQAIKQNILRQAKRAINSLVEEVSEVRFIDNDPFMLLKVKHETEVIYFELRIKEMM